MVSKVPKKELKNLDCLVQKRKNVYDKNVLDFFGVFMRQTKSFFRSLFSFSVSINSIVGKFLSWWSTLVALTLLQNYLVQETCGEIVFQRFLLSINHEVLASFRYLLLEILFFFYETFATTGKWVRTVF